MLEVPPALRIDANAAVLAFLHGKSAHSDVAVPLESAARDIEGVGIFCPDGQRFRYLLVYAETRVFGCAAGMHGVWLRLSGPARVAALREGAQLDPALGDDWLFFELFGSRGFLEQLTGWVRKAHASRSA